MTNEMLADFIKQGGNDELIPILWEKVRVLLYSKSDTFYRLNKEQCDRKGVDNWDIRQASYTAYLKAVRSFDIKTGYKFTTYLAYPFKNALKDLLGATTKRARQEPLNNSTSLDKPIEQSDGDTITMGEFIADDTSLDFIQDMERTAEAETVRRIVETLPDVQKDVIKAYYFEGMTLSAIAEKLCVSIESVRQIRYKALKILRENKQLRELYTGYQHHYNWIAVSHFRYSPEYFDLCKRLDEKNLSYGQKQADIYSHFQEWQGEHRSIVPPVKKSRFF